MGSQNLIAEVGRLKQNKENSIRVIFFYQGQYMTFVFSRINLLPERSNNIKGKKNHFVVITMT